MDIRIDRRRYAVVRLPARAPVPDWLGGAFLSLTRTESELSIVVPEEQVPEDLVSERDWRRLTVVGPIAFSEVGVLAALAAPLAEAGVSIFTISTYDTDHLLVKATSLERAVTALKEAGHRLLPSGGDQR